MKKTITVYGAVVKKLIICTIVIVFINSSLLGFENQFSRSIMFGATLGVGPLMGLNIIGGYSFERFGSLVTFGYKGSDNDFLDVQNNLFYKLNENRFFVHSIGIVAGYDYVTRDPEKEDMKWLYGGLAYNVNVGGAYIEIALTKGKSLQGDSPIPIFQYLSTQFGYVFRFF